MAGMEADMMSAFSKMYAITTVDVAQDLGREYDIPKEQ